MRPSFLAIVLLCSVLAFAAERPPTLAVMPLEVQGSDSASGSVYAAVIADELLKSGSVRVLERSQVDRILKEQGFQQSGACDGSECAVEVGRLLGIERMVVGSVGSVGESRVFTVRTVEVGTGEVVASARRLHQGTPEQAVTDLLPALASDLLQGMGRPVPTVKTPAPSQGNAAPRPEVKVQTPKAPSRTGWSIGASGQFQPKEVGIEESMRGGTIEGTWHVSSLPWLELGVGADLALRHRVSSVYFGNLHRIESSNSAFGMDGRVECVLKPGFGVRTRGQVGYYVPWVEKRYESEGSQQGFNAAAFAGWETGSLAIDAGIETDWSEAGPMAGMGFPSEAFLLSVRWRLR